MLLDEFNRRYKYISDKEKYNTFLDIWEVPKLEQDGFYYGDCESYCRFLKAHIEWFKDFEYYYCKLDGVGHCVLIKDNLIIDCNIKQPVSLEVYSSTFKVSEFRKYPVLQVLSKILVTQGFLLWKRLTNF